MNMYDPISNIRKRQNEFISSTLPAELVNGLNSWIGLADRTPYEHERVMLRIPVGAMRWPASFYDYKGDSIEANGTIDIDVSGREINIIFRISNLTDLSSVHLQEYYESGEESVTKVFVSGLILTPNDIRSLIVWIVQHLRPLEFSVQTAVE